MHILLIIHMKMGVLNKYFILLMVMDSFVVGKDLKIILKFTILLSMMIKHHELFASTSVLER